MQRIREQKAADEKAVCVIPVYLTVKRELEREKERRKGGKDTTEAKKKFEQQQRQYATIIFTNKVVRRDMEHRLREKEDEKRAKEVIPFVLQCNLQGNQKETGTRQTGKRSRKKKTRNGN